MRLPAPAVVLMLANLSCHNRDGGPTRGDGCTAYCDWAVKCTEAEADFLACLNACSIELESCSSGDEYDTILDFMDCAERSCDDSCAADDDDDCTFEWP